LDAEEDDRKAARHTIGWNVAADERRGGIGDGESGGDRRDETAGAGSGWGGGDTEVGD
jgi:hypothetical protein